MFKDKLKLKSQLKDYQKRHILNGLILLDNATREFAGFEMDNAYWVKLDKLRSEIANDLKESDIEFSSELLSLLGIS